MPERVLTRVEYPWGPILRCDVCGQWWRIGGAYPATIRHGCPDPTPVWECAFCLHRVAAAERPRYCRSHKGYCRFNAAGEIQ